MSVGAPAMPPAKKKTPPPDERVVIVHLKGSPRYAAFMEAVHRKTHIPKASMVRLALEAWFKQNGHGEPPEI
jgi:hypothetical protein